MANPEIRPPIFDRISISGSKDVSSFFAPYFDVTIYNAVDEEIDVEENTDGSTPESPTDNYQPLSLEEFVTDQAAFGIQRVQIVTKEGETLVFAPGDVSITNFRSNLVIEARASTAYKATLTLQPPLEDAIRIVDNEVIQYGALMAIEWGYLSVGNAEPVISDRGLFSIVQPTLSLGREFTVQISGWDIMSRSAEEISRRVTYPVDDYETDLKIIEKVFKRAAPTGAELITNRLPEDSPLRDKRKETDAMVQDSDDWQFFRNLLTENDAAFIVQNRKVIILDINNETLKDPHYSLLWYKQPTEATDIPMIDFSSNSIPELFAPSGIRGYFTTFTEQFKGVAVERSRSSSDLGAGTVGGGKSQTTEEARSQTTRKFTEGGDIVNAPPNEKDEDPTAAGDGYSQEYDEPNRDKRVKNAARQKRRVGNTQATATIMGHPALQPLMNVNVEGLGKTFSKTYRVLKVTHEVGQGYICRLELLRSATTGDPRDPAHRKIKDKAQTGDDGVQPSGGDAPLPEPEELSASETTRRL